jgi:hypothetical protein
MQICIDHTCSLKIIKITFNGLTNNSCIIIVLIKGVHVNNTLQTIHDLESAHGIHLRF